MQYSKISVLKDMTYYIIVVFKHKDKQGQIISNEYKLLQNALRKFNELIKSGLYECVMLRKEEVFYRDPTNEYSSSNPFKKWEIA